MDPRNPMTSSRQGFALADVLVALALFGLLFLAGAGLAGDSQRLTTDRTARDAALRIAHNETERTASANPWQTPDRTDFQANQDGVPDSTGLYHIHVDYQTDCNGGAYLNDNTEVLPERCGTQRPSATYLIQVDYPSPLEPSGTGSVRIRNTQTTPHPPPQQAWQPAAQP